MGVSPFAETSVGLRLAPPAGAADEPASQRWQPLAVRHALLPWLAPLGLLLAWQMVTSSGLVSEQLLVPPLVVLSTFVELWQSGELFGHLRSSLGRLAIGFGSGAVSGLAFGVLLGTSRSLATYTEPLFQAVRQLPSVALIPAFILIFGVEETFKVLLVAKACFFPVALAARDGTKNISRHYLEVAALYQLPRTVSIRRLIIPAVTPSVIAGVRVSLGRSWMVLVAAELMAADRGLGQMMEMGRQMFRMDIVVVGVLASGAIGLLLDRSVRVLEKRAARWRPTTA